MTTKRKLGGLIKIDKKVPLPPQRRGNQTAKYPWKAMKRGDSFFVKGVPQKRFSSRAAYAARLIGHGCKFATRVVDGGVRVWRVK